ncbi:MAG: outer membrane protein assembly factor, partial [Jannaschia sp.]
MRLRICAAAAVCVFLSSKGLLAANLQLDLGADEDLAAAIETSSLVAEAARSDDASRRDIVAAAQADYSRLLAVLFEAGHFSPVISILVDGTEAAALPSIGTTGDVGTVTITVQPGPIFLFGAATIGPLPDGVLPPEGFATGAQAGTAILRTATGDGIDAWRARGHAKAALAGQ